MSSSNAKFSASLRQPASASLSNGYSTRRPTSPSLGSRSGSDYSYTQTTPKTAALHRRPLTPQSAPPAERYIDAMSGDPLAVSSAVRTAVTSATLARTISQRKAVTPNSSSGRRPRVSADYLGSSRGVSGVEAQLNSRHEILQQASSTDVGPAIASLERALADEICDLQRVTEKLERRIASILTIQEHRQLLVNVAENSPKGAAAHRTFIDDPMHSNSVLHQVTSIQLFNSPPTGSSFGEASANVWQPENVRSVAWQPNDVNALPLVVDIERSIDPRPLAPPVPVSQPIIVQQQPLLHVVPAPSPPKPDISFNELRSTYHSASIQPAPAVTSDVLVYLNVEPTPEKQPARDVSSHEDVLISAKLSNAELHLVHYQQELLSLQSEVISLQRQNADVASLSRLRLMLRDELSLCKKRECRVADLEERFHKSK